MAETAFPHEALEQAFGNLQSRWHKGVIELLYKDRTAGIDLDANSDAVADILNGLLTGSLPLTFKQAQA